MEKRERKFDQNRAFILIYNAALVAFHLSQQRVRNWFNSARVSIQFIVALTACITYSRHDKCCLNMPHINIWALSWTWIYIFINTSRKKMHSMSSADLICLSLFSLAQAIRDMSEHQVNHRRRPWNKEENFTQGRFNPHWEWSIYMQNVEVLREPAML